MDRTGPIIIINIKIKQIHVCKVLRLPTYCSLKAAVRGWLRWSGLGRDKRIDGRTKTSNTTVAWFVFAVGVDDVSFVAVVVFCVSAMVL